MCVIINKPSDIQISREVLRKCWKANPHGAGFMYTYSGHLIVKKGLMTFEEFYREYKKIDENIPTVIHFRLASYGKVAPEQTHPMYVNDRLAFVHNGHLMNKFIKEGTSNEMSDTMILNEKIFRMLAPNFLTSPVIKELITGYIENSVVLFLDNEGNVTILGDDEDGIEYKGSWFSNDYWDVDKWRYSKDLDDNDGVFADTSHVPPFVEEDLDDHTRI